MSLVNLLVIIYHLVRENVMKKYLVLLVGALFAQETSAFFLFRKAEAPKTFRMVATSYACKAADCVKNVPLVQFAMKRSNAPTVLAAGALAFGFVFTAYKFYQGFNKQAGWKASTKNFWNGITLANIGAWFTSFKFWGGKPGAGAAGASSATTADSTTGGKSSSTTTTTTSTTDASKAGGQQLTDLTTTKNSGKATEDINLRSITDDSITSTRKQAASPTSGSATAAGNTVGGQDTIA